jgi:hypothetical protein
MAAPTVDLDLFVNSMSKGVSDGAKLPSMFSGLVQGAIEGYGIGQKFEANSQASEINQNTIDQLPIKNRIEAAQADRADAELAGYRKDPAKYAELAGQKQENELAIEKQRAELITQKVEFQNIMQTGTPREIADAVNSGRYTGLFAAEPAQRKSAVDAAWVDGGFTQEERKNYIEVENKKLIDETYGFTESQLSTLKQQKELAVVDAEIGTLREKAAASLNQDIDIDKLLSKGATVPYEIKKYEQKQKLKTDANGKVTGEVEIDPTTKKPVMIDNLQAPLPVRRIQAFQLDGKVVLDADGDPFEMTPEATKAFRTGSNAYKLLNKKNADQAGGIGELEAKSNNIEKTKAAREAADNAYYSASEVEKNKLKSQFTDGSQLKVSPRYTPAAQSLQNQVNQNIDEEGRAKSLSTQTSDEFVNETFNVPATGRQGVVVPTNYAQTFAPLSSTDSFARQSTSQAPAAGTPGPTSSTPSGNPAPVNITPGRAKALEAIKARTKAATGGQGGGGAGAGGESDTPPPSPVRQAEMLTTSANLPPQMEVNGGVNISVDVVKRVASNPLVQGFPALTKAVFAHESGGRTQAASGTGVVGIAQTTQETTNEVIPGGDRTDPKISTAAGALYFQNILMTPGIDGNPLLALAAYNGGPGLVAKAISKSRSTNWVDLQDAIQKEILSPEMRSYWMERKINPIQKAKEVREYPAKVISYFPAFAKTSDDMKTAQILKEQNILNF